MFTKPIDEITFEDVKSFCEEWGEGVRVEYKSELNVKNHIPKVVSSFANTYGGIFLIGIETDKTTNMPILPIEGLPNRRHIEESIQQSAEMSINPLVRPEVKIVNVGDGENVVVVVRVAEGSLLAPHAIEDSTKAYFRVGSITQPYKLELANMELIAHMFKRREDSQVVARQILDQIEARVGRVEPTHITIEYKIHSLTNIPTLTVIARPVFPYRPLTSVSNIYESHRGPLSPPRRVAGGHFCYDKEEYWELNEYGIVYHRTLLYNDGQLRIDYGQFIWHTNDLINRANALYVDCGYMGNVEITVQLQHVFHKILVDTEGYEYGRKITDNLYAEPRCYDSEVIASRNCLARDLEGENERKALVEELTCPLLWAFNIPIDKPQIRGKIRKRIEREFS